MEIKVITSAASGGVYLGYFGYVPTLSPYQRVIDNPINQVTIEEDEGEEKEEEHGNL